MAEVIEEAQSLESTTVGIYRTATVVKGGRRFSFAALVVVGDRQGSVGVGYGKAPGVPAAIEKAQKDARKHLFKVTLKQNTIPHPVVGRFGASKVQLIPAAPGSGVIAGATVRAVLEMVGISDCLTKATGSTNKKNLCKAVIEGLKQLRSKEEVERLRGMDLGKTEVEQKIEAGQRFMVETAGSESGSKKQAAAAPDKSAESTESAESSEQNVAGETAAETSVEVAQEQPPAEQEGESSEEDRSQS